MNMHKVAANLILKGEHQLVRKLRKVVAFDTRFNLFCNPEYKNEHVKCIYLLDNPLFDKYYEVVFTDNTKKLMGDKEVTELLKHERDFAEEMANKAKNQLKKVKQFSKMGDLEVDPLEAIKMQQQSEENQSQMESVDEPKKEVVYENDDAEDNDDEDEDDEES